MALICKSNHVVLLPLKSFKDSQSAQVETPTLQHVVMGLSSPLTSQGSLGLSASCLCPWALSCQGSPYVQERFYSPCTAQSRHHLCEVCLDPSLSHCLHLSPPRATYSRRTARPPLVTGSLHIPLLSLDGELLQDGLGLTLSYVPVRSLLGAGMNESIN